MEKTIDERLAELKKKHDKEIVEIERERALFQVLVDLKLPLPTRVLHFNPELWLGYKVGSDYSSLGQPAKIDDGLAIVAQFEDYIQDLVAVDDGCIRVSPMALQPEPRQLVDKDGKELPREHKIRWALDQAVEFHQSGGDGFRSCGWRANIQIEGQRPMQVRVDVAPAPWDTLTHKVEREGNYEGARIIRRWVELLWPYEEQPDKHIRWSAGTPTSWHMSYYWTGVPTLIRKEGK